MMMKNKIISALICIALSGCFSTKVQYVKIKQLKSDLPTIIRCDTTKNTVRFIGFCLLYKIKNNKFKELKVLPPSYSYRGLYTKGRDQWKLGMASTYLRGTNNELIGFSINDKRCSFEKEKEFVFMTIHYPDTFPEVKKFIAPYIERMKAHKKDTLHIESIQELKKTHPEFLANILLNDTITFLFTRDKIYDQFIDVRQAVKVK